MKLSNLAVAITAGFITKASAHGRITSPTACSAGAATEAACGTQVYNNQTSDRYGNIQGELQVAASQTDYKAAACDIWLCKGFKYADNTANVQTWTAGQTVDFQFDIRAPHTGTANVSIVNTATNTVIGDQLLYYPDFADNAKSIPANETSFSVAIPSGLGDTCSTLGACVVQHYWNSASINQTYETCVDFVVGGSGSSASVSSSSAGAVSSASSTSSPAAVKSTVTSNFSAVRTTLQTIASPALYRHLETLALARNMSVSH